MRKEIDHHVDEFLAQGGKVDGIPAGTSGRDTHSALPTTFEPKNQERTPVLAEIQALESRKASLKPTTIKQPRKTARKHLLRDDFGEPIRWVWKED